MVVEQKSDRARDPLLAWHGAVLKNREEAGRLLANRLLPYRDHPDGLVLALPRGGVVVGYFISLTLHLPLDVILTRKLGAPGNSEFAIGAVAETGSVFLNPGAQEMAATCGVPGDYLEREVREQRQEIERRRSLYRHGRPLPDLTGRVVILVDDGIATGATFLSAVNALKSCGVGGLIAAIPVGPLDTLEAVRQHVDALIVLSVPESFFAVANHYLDFVQVEDPEVMHYLEEAEKALREQARDRHS